MKGFLSILAKPTIGIITLVFSIFSIENAQADNTMSKIPNFPAAIPTSSEIILKDEEKSKLPSLRIAREMASKHKGVIISSEVVTHEVRFGYIFRYRIVELIPDYEFVQTEGGGKEIVKKDSLSESNSLLILFSQDGKKFSTWITPMSRINGSK